jgi:micrococcal nuclease
MSNYFYPATVDKIVDGDTFDVTLDLGFKIYRKERLRLYGIDAYEVKKYKGVTDEEKAKGIEARDRLQEALPVGTKIFVETFKGKDTGKYGRYLAMVWVGHNTAKDSYNLLNENYSENDIIPLNDELFISINKWLIVNGYAVEKEY